VALGGWSMGGGGAQLAAVEDSTIKAIIALCSWIDPAQITINSLNHDSPVLFFSGQIDIIAPPSTHANVHYSYTPNTTDKLIYEIILGGHTVANSPSGGQGEVGRMALSWLKKYLIEDSCHCPLLLDTPLTASVYHTNIACPIYGCTDSLACNYDYLANANVIGSCIYPTSSTVNITECDNCIWNGVTYALSGIYTYSSTNTNGCDSIATLNLTINQSDTSYTTITACDSIIWNGVTYALSGTYTYSSANTNGCDSIATLNLTINQSDTSYTTITACDSMIWNGVTYALSGIYTYITANANGCDSVETINLTIDYPSMVYDTVSVTSSIVWNGTPLNVSGDYSVTLINLVGCDSIVNLNLTITNTTGLLDVTNTEKTLLKITDMLGQETPYRKNTPLFNIYDDGTVEKRIVIE